jgi:hypothetical protein
MTFSTTAANTSTNSPQRLQNPSNLDQTAPAEGRMNSGRNFTIKPEEKIFFSDFLKSSHENQPIEQFVEASRRNSQIKKNLKKI